jgi:hypothetical protein
MILQKMESYTKEENLFLILKSEWYWMIDFGIKKEEYREFGEYWAITRGLLHREFKTVTFQLGYSLKNRMVFEIQKIDLGIGNPEWGARGQETFIIKLGKRLSN